LPHLLAFQASAFDQLSHLSTPDDKESDEINYTMKREALSTLPGRLTGIPQIEL
jgi:hypothetical protein